MNSNPAITASTRPRSRATSSDSTPRPRRRGRWQVAGGEHGRQVRGPERPRLAPPSISGGPPVPGEHPGGPLTGGSGLPGELRAEARRGDRHRGARGRAAGVVQLGEVGGHARVVELAPAEPGVEPPQRAGVGTPRVRADGGLDQAARGLRRPPDLGLCGVGPGG